MGARHKRYLKKYKRATYTVPFTSGKSNGYLAHIDGQAEEMFSRLVVQMAERGRITERLKAIIPIAWVGAMNNIWNRATEIVNSEVIYR